MGLVANVRGDVGSDVGKSVEGAEREMDEEAASKHQYPAEEQQPRRPLAHRQRRHVVPAV